MDSRPITGTCSLKSSRHRTTSVISTPNSTVSSICAPRTPQQLAAVAAGLDADPAGPVEKNPRYRDAVAQRDEAARQLAHTFVKAPFAGIVTNVPSIAPGKYLPSSMTACYLVATGYVWVDSNPKETELTNVRPGQPVTVTVDTYPDEEWHGARDSVTPP